MHVVPMLCACLIGGGQDRRACDPPKSPCVVPCCATGEMSVCCRVTVTDAFARTRKKKKKYCQTDSSPCRWPPRRPPPGAPPAVRRLAAAIGASMMPSSAWPFVWKQPAVSARLATTSRTETASGWCSLRHSRRAPRQLAAGGAPNRRVRLRMRARRSGVAAGRRATGVAAQRGLRSMRRRWRRLQLRRPTKRRAARHRRARPRSRRRLAARRQRRRRSRGGDGVWPRRAAWAA